MLPCKSTAKEVLFGRSHHRILFTDLKVELYDIQLETIDITKRLWGYDIRICMVYTIKPCSDVYCLKLNFNIYQIWAIDSGNEMVKLCTFLNSQKKKT